jgi:hypothetical protein
MGGVATLAPGAHNAAAFPEGRLTHLPATHADLEMRLRITAATNTRAIPAVRQRSLRSAPVAAHPLHARMFDGKDIEKGTQRRRPGGLTGCQCIRMGLEVFREPGSMRR